MIILNILIAITIIYTVICAYTDIKWRIAPDYLTYSLIFLGLGGNAIISLITQNWTYFLFSSGFTVVVFGAGYLLSYLGMWGMGDTKILTGYAAVFSVWPAFVSFVAPWPFVITIWLNSILVAPLLVIIFIIYKIIKLRKKILPDLQKEIHKKRKITFFIAILLLACISTYAINSLLGTMLLTGWAFSTIFFYFLVLGKFMDKRIYIMKKPSELIEGDVPLGIIEVPGKLKKWGLSKKQINYIKKHSKKALKIKEGFPMVVAYLFSLIISLLFGDLIYKIISVLVWSV